jgi:hypothetical protein
MRFFLAAVGIVGLFSSVASAQTISHHRHHRQPQALYEAYVPVQAAAPASTCRIVPAQTNPYCPPDCQFVTACGPSATN